MLENNFEKEKTCRACTKSNIDLSSLFAKQDAPDDVCFSDMITECTMYTVQEDDGLPNLICSECKDKARVAYDFKKQCEESHRRLLSLIQSINGAPMVSDKGGDTVEVEETELRIPEENNTLRKKSTRSTVCKKHPCEKCDRTFTKLEEYKEHVRTEHKAPRHFCPLCSKEFIRLGHFMRHYNKVHKNEDTAEENTKEEISLKTESQSAIEPETTFEKSSKEVSVAEDYNFDFGMDLEDDPTSHADSESIKSIKAESEVAENKIKADKNPTNDEESNENKEKEEESIVKEEQKPVKTAKSTKSSGKPFTDSNRRFQCDQCHKAFKRKSHLKQHSLCHTKVKPYQCTICQKRFGRPDNLKVHMSNHGQKQFQCSSCDRSFGQAYLLKRHKDQTHSEEKPFLCSECGQRFVRNGDLAVHMRRHTGEKPYKCQYCNKGFTRSTEVYVHERYHTGEKRHVCTICGKAFQRPYNLLVHVRTHTGERPYQCPHCPKNFAQCSDLKAHIRRHTGERYRCEQCGMGFIHVFVLNQHKLSAHGIEVQSRIKRVAKLSTDTQ